MNDEELRNWFEAHRVTLETAYLAGTHPWQQSGVGLRTPRSGQDWDVLRRPIAACLNSAGTFLDVGCANGYLLECLLRWTQKRHMWIIPYGLDFSAKLVALARERLPKYADHLFVGNAWDWLPPRQFDYVNTTLDYVPEDLREAFVHRLLWRFVLVGGRLLIAECDGRSTGLPGMRIDEQLRQWGFSLELVTASRLEQDALAHTRVAVIRKTAPCRCAHVWANGSDQIVSLAGRPAQSIVS